MANEQNLIPMNKRTKSEQREYTKKGGQKSGEVRRQRKAMKEEWGISDEEELIREKTIARIDIEVKNKEQEKSKMFKEEVSE